MNTQKLKSLIEKKVPLEELGKLRSGLMTLRNLVKQRKSGKKTDVSPKILGTLREHICPEVLFADQLRGLETFREFMEREDLLINDFQDTDYRKLFFLELEGSDLSAEFVEGDFDSFLALYELYQEFSVEFELLVNENAKGEELDRALEAAEGVSDVVGEVLAGREDEVYVMKNRRHNVTSDDRRLNHEISCFDFRNQGAKVGVGRFHDEILGLKSPDPCICTSFLLRVAESGRREEFKQEFMDVLDLFLNREVLVCSDAQGCANVLTSLLFLCEKGDWRKEWNILKRIIFKKLATQFNEKEIGVVLEAIYFFGWEEEPDVIDFLKQYESGFVREEKERLKEENPLVNILSQHFQRWLSGWRLNYKVVEEAYYRGLFIDFKVTILPPDSGEEPMDFFFEFDGASFHLNRKGQFNSKTCKKNKLINAQGIRCMRIVNSSTGNILEHSEAALRPIQTDVHQFIFSQLPKKEAVA